MILKLSLFDVSVLFWSSLLQNQMKRSYNPDDIFFLFAMSYDWTTDTLAS